MNGKIRVAIVGAGHWGPNLIRLINNHDACDLKMIVENNHDRCSLIHQKFPGIKIISDYQNIDKASIDGIVIATPTSTHFEIVKRFIKLNKHIFVEKPVTNSLKEAKILKKLLKQNYHKCFMVGHIYLYSPIIKKVKSIIQSGELGSIYHLTMERTNLGPIRTDVNLTLDLASHDVSILSYLLNMDPILVSSVQGSWINTGISDTAFSTLSYQNNILANIQSSWLSPKKSREIRIVGSKKMMIVDELNEDDPIVIYDKGVKDKPLVYPYFDNYIQYKRAIKNGESKSVKVSKSQPLEEEINYFVNAIKHKIDPITNLDFGIKIMCVLEAMQLSAKKNGLAIKVMV